MDVLIQLTSDSMPHTTILVPTGSLPLVFTAAAAAFVSKRLQEQGASCRQCGLFCRVGELADGRCKRAVGCSTDVEWAALMAAPKQVQWAIMAAHADAAVGALTAAAAEAAIPPALADPLDRALWQAFFGEQ